MAAGRSSRNNVLAGMFVLACILLGVAVVVILSNIGDFLKPTNTYTVRFSISDGAEGLDRGAAVKLGGQRVGRVTETRFVEDEVSGEPAFVDVKIQVPKRLKIYTDADVQLNRPLLGSGSTLNIVSIRSSTRPGVEYMGPPVLLEPGQTIIGHLGPPAFLAPTDYAKFQDIIARVDRITANVEPRVNAIIDDASETVKSIRSLTSDIEGRWKTWGPKADNIVAEVEKIAKQVEPILTSVGDGVNEVRGRVDQVKNLIASGQKFVDENGPRISNSIKDVEELTAKAKNEMYNEVLSTIQSARAAVNEAQEAAKTARAFVDQNAPELTEIIASAGLAANQLKLATVEIRSAPWRLLYQPSKKELENELLYNSVRQYSESVSELRRAAAKLADLTARVETLPENQRAAERERLARMSVELERSFAEYQKQERAFLSRWSAEAKK
jgi:ABC-type transporter Mla subunit MlaD